MADKRAFPRRKKRFLVDVITDGGTSSGFTIDLSHTGVFVQSARFPRMGDPVTIRLHVSDKSIIELKGTAVRAKRVPPALAFSEPNGFSLQISGYSEEYFKLLTALEQSATSSKIAAPRIG